jgi:hypothetical protein
MRNFLFNDWIARVSSVGPYASLVGGAVAIGVELLNDPGPVNARGELLALLLPGFALFGSEFVGVGWCSSADRLALLLL